MASKAKKKSKVSDRFSREQAATIHAEADADKTTDGRAKIYMKHGLSRQEAAQLFRSSSLPKLSDAAPSKKTKPAAGKASKKTTKGPAKATATAPTPETKRRPQPPKQPLQGRPIRVSTRTSERLSPYKPGLSPGSWVTSRPSNPKSRHVLSKFFMSTLSPAVQTGRREG